MPGQAASNRCVARSSTGHLATKKAVFFVSTFTPSRIFNAEFVKLEQRSIE